MRSIFALSFCLIALLFMPFSSTAQIANTGSTLTVSPEFPEPNENFTVKLGGSGANRTNIVWFVDGIEDIASKNKTTVALKAKEQGKQTNITARITSTNGSALDLRHTVVPVRVDLVVEADTLVPAFYKGRALPSSGSAVRVTALTFGGGTGSLSSYSYLWKLNGKTQNGGALLGQNTFTFTPGFEKEALVEVTIFTSAGNAIASESQLIPIAEPELYFYEKNPLRGLSVVAMNNPYIFIGDELTVRAEGYFMGQELSGTDILNEWEIDGRKVAGNADSPQEITLQKRGNNVRSQLSFHIRNLRQLLQGVEKSIMISF